MTIDSQTDHTPFRRVTLKRKSLSEFNLEVNKALTTGWRHFEADLKFRTDGNTTKTVKQYIFNPRNFREWTTHVHFDPPAHTTQVEIQISQIRPALNALEGVTKLTVYEARGKLRFIRASRIAKGCRCQLRSEL